MTIKELIDTFEPIRLEDLGNCKLMDRTDKKYVVYVEDLCNILSSMEGVYKVLDINGVRQFDYNSQYFDTSSLSMFADSDNNVLPRYKVRIRTYINSGDKYLEIKKKTIKKGNFKTKKVRKRIKRDTLVDFAWYIRNKTGYHISELSNVVDITYKRITLVNTISNERITIDTDMVCKNNTLNEVIEFNKDKCIVEVKQHTDNKSVMIDNIEKLEKWRKGFSKYCYTIRHTVS